MSNVMEQGKTELATFGGGCFWCTEAAFEQLRGVNRVLPGYMGGHDPAPTYEKICRGDSGHAEVVQLEFDPQEISYEALLTVFFAIHDPTTLNRQGYDVGTQYRSAIFCHTPEQQAQAEALIGQWNAQAIWPTPIVTEVRPAGTFHVAETYHHEYFRNNPGQGYCMAVVAPKAAKVRAAFAGLLRDAGD